MRIGCEKFDIIGVEKALVIMNGYKDVICWMKNGEREESWGFDGAHLEKGEVIEEMILESGDILYRVV
jgi:hypothetical protein